MNHSLTIVLENIRSALNVGAILRTCEASQIEKLYLLGITPYPPHNKIPKTALGTEDDVNWEYVKDYQNVKLNLPEPIIAIEIAPGAESYFNFKFPSPCTIVFGNEISGVSKYFLDKSTNIVKIPMFGKKESLNVATSVGIITYEIIRQWNQNG